jgi:thiol:disulfide interchange protein DsbA
LKAIVALILSCLVAAGAWAQSPASSFKEGVNYRRLTPAQPTTVAPGHVEVVEVFWYGCPHCFDLDPLIESWRKQGKPGYVDFARLPAIWNETAKIHAKLFYTTQTLGKLEELHTPIFREIHINKNPLNTDSKIESFFTAHGVSEQDYRKASGSFSVITKMSQAEYLNDHYRVTSVPLVIVNGKWVTDVGMAGGEKQLITLMTELAAREHG